MSERKTTPWRVDEDIREGVTRNAKPELVGYNIMSDAGEIVGCEGLLADKEGDAYLIASAPTMLSALKAMDEALTEDWVSPSDDVTRDMIGERTCEAWIQIRSAISQADGR